MRRAAIILNAGASRRMGRPKGALTYSRSKGRESSFLQRAVELAGLACKATAVVVVCSPESAFEDTDVRGLEMAMNRYPERGMFSSIQCGLKRVGEGAHVMVLLVDHPLVQRRTIAALWAEAEKHPDRTVVPMYAGRAGHPVVLCPAAVAQALDAPAGDRLDVLIAHGPLRRLGVGDPGVVRNINTPVRYAWFFGGP